MIVARQASVRAGVIRVFQIVILDSASSVVAGEHDDRVFEEAFLSQGGKDLSNAVIQVHDRRRVMASHVAGDR